MFAARHVPSRSFPSLTVVTHDPVPSLSSRVVTPEASRRNGGEMNGVRDEKGAEGTVNGRDHYVVDRSLPYRFAHSHYHPSHPRLSPYGSAPKEARRAYRTERETRVNGKDYNVM